MTGANTMPNPEKASSESARLHALHERLAKIAGASLRGSDRACESPISKLDSLTRRFGLSEAESDALLFVAAAELCETTATLIASIGTGAPSVGLLLRVCEGLEWKDLRLDGALRRGCLLALGGSPRQRFTERAVWLEESVLFYLQGVIQLDAELVARALPASGVAEDRMALDPSTIRAIVEHCSQRGSGPSIPPVLVVGSDVHSALAHAVAAMRETQHSVVVMSFDGLPQDLDELEQLQRRWLRDCLLHDLALVLLCDRCSGDFSTLRRLRGWVGAVALVSSQELAIDGTLARVHIHHRAEDRLRAWKMALSPEDLRRHDDALDSLATRFCLSSSTIGALAESNGSGSSEALWMAARRAARTQAPPFVERVEPSVELARVVLPKAAKRTVEEIVVAATHHHFILREWKRVGTGGRGLGISALFRGPSGTGKTMAAEAIAAELQLDLFRVELSAVVSKYIGETEKNLRRIFSSAQTAGAVLLFDEADALFGKRSEAKDARDRYANMEVGYLLQLMESFEGVVILTTNFADALDDAFKRRLRFVVDFKLPDQPLRALIWDKVFPVRPVLTKSQWTKLSRLSLSGGMIRSVALGASLRCGESSAMVKIDHLLSALRDEYSKLGRSLEELNPKEWS